MKFFILFLFACSSFSILEQKLSIKVNNVAPRSNPSETYKYYSLPFLPPKEEIKSDLSFSQSISGDRLYNSPYVSIIGKNSTDTEQEQQLTIGSKQYYIEELNIFKEAINNEFYAEFYVEDFITRDMIGIVINASQEGQLYFLKHHIEFNVYLDINKPEVIYSNITNFVKSDYLNLYYTLLQIPEGQETLEIKFTYNVNYVYASRSDILYQQDDLFNQLEPNQENFQTKIYWTAIFLSFFLVIFLLGVVAIVLGKALKRDFIISADIECDSSMEIGWKLIRTEALQPPNFRLFLSSFLGNGLQFIYLVISLVLFGALGLYNNNQKGNVKSAGVFLYSLTGMFNGYYSAYFYKYFGGKKWTLNFILTSCLFPMGFLLVFIIVNSYAWYKGSTSAIPAESVFLVFLILAFVFLPLTLGGSLVSRVKSTNILPSADTSIPRLYKPIPERKIYQTGIFQFLLGGLIPFISISLVLYQIFTCVWGHQNYHLFGALAISIILFLSVQACVSISLTYLQLNSLDYNWWWRSFSYGGSTSMFIVIYVIYFYWHQSPMHGTLQFLMYFGYMLLACSVSFMMLGSVSFLSSLKFVRYIYDNSKQD